MNEDETREPSFVEVGLKHVRKSSEWDTQKYQSLDDMIYGSLSQHFEEKPFYFSKRNDTIDRETY
jgi:hypothetical protein